MSPSTCREQKEIASRSRAKLFCEAAHDLALAPSPRAFIDLGAIPSAPGCARAWTREILWEWGLASVADRAETVVSEFVTNAVNACCGWNLAVISVILTFNRDELAILVRDGHPGVPLPGTPGEDDESGRGLLLAWSLICALPRTPVALDILARVKVALERL
jgi:hypothetical protein